MFRNSKPINSLFLMACMLFANAATAQVRKATSLTTTLTYQAAAAVLNNPTSGTRSNASSVYNGSSPSALGTIIQQLSETSSFSIHDPIPNVVADHQGDILLFSLRLASLKLTNNNYTDNDYTSDRNILASYDNESSYPVKVPEDYGLTIIKLKVLRPIENYALAINDSFMNDPTFSYLPGQGGQVVYLLWPQVAGLIFSLK